MGQAFSQWNITTDCSGLSGALDRETVPSLWQQVQKWQPAQGEFECSLQDVERIDSAGMVMLIHLIEHAKKQNCHIMFSSAPAQLRTLFQLSNIESLVNKHIKNYQG